MNVSRDLLRWYGRHARSLPWRVPPGEMRRAEPYHVWLSEVMLQQTTVAAVVPYFHRFLARFPTVADLAAADEAEVMAMWAGLGYYARARNLHACAKAVAAAGGAFPRTSAGLRALPGIGDYTAAAIAAIAFGERAAVVDGNIERVVLRLLTDETPLPAARANVRRFMAEATPADRPGDFVQAMMDLGATICTPRSPSCLVCPLASGCAARAEGRATAFPVKAPRKARPRRRGAAFVALRDSGNGQEVWLTRRPSRGLLGGMAQVPTTGWSSRTDGDTEADAAPFPADWHHAGVAEHGFTHFEIALDIYRTSLEPGDGPDGGGWWAATENVNEHGLPTLFAKVVGIALANGERSP